MTRFFKTVLILSALLMTVPGGYARAGAKATVPAPPVGQPLVREGDFAVQLARALYPGTDENEADAERLLMSVGIAPENGWISDYPVTPDTVMALQHAVDAAADSGQLAVGKDEALHALLGIAGQFGLPLSSASEASIPGSGPAAAGNSGNPGAINAYYDANGPPVVTYYPPPPAYIYQYAWVPYPFWYGTYFFKGYYCLHDFVRTVYIGPTAGICTNHVRDPDTREIYIIDPTTRRRGEFYRIDRGSGFHRERRSDAVTRGRGAGREYREHRERQEYRRHGSGFDHGDSLRRRQSDGVPGGFHEDGFRDRR